MERLFAASGKQPQPFVTYIYVCLLDKDVLVALEVHSGSRYHVQLFFKLPLAQFVLVAYPAPHISIVVDRSQPLLVAHLPQGGVVSRMYGSSVFYKRGNLRGCYTISCKMKANKQIGIRMMSDSLYLVKC